MVLQTLKLTNFRNYTNLELVLSPVTLLIGENAQGKSNLLDAVYCLATSKSLRAEKDIEMISQDADHLYIEGDVLQGGDITKLEVGLQNQQGVLSKRIKVNGVPKRVVDYIGNLVVVYFVPEDINLVTGPPALRRWHLDVTLAQIDREYKRAITIYSEAVTARNRILKRIKEGLAKLNELDFWTQQVIEHGSVVTQKRQAFFDFLQTSPRLLGEFRFLYHPSEINNERVREYLNREVAATTTLIGPHRDDFIFKLEGKDLAHFGSRGEQRTTVLELKLAELSFITKSKGETPVLLLDDVFAELDDQHQDKVAEAVFQQQTLITAVENEKIPQRLAEGAKVLRVFSGNVETRS